ncbi:MAG: glycosyltransferase family 4 protein [Telluria sp.]
MNVLFVHQNFPGQYLHLARKLAADPANDVVFLTQRQAGTLPNVRKVVYQTPATRAVPHPWLRGTTTHVQNAEAVAQAALVLRQQGFRPDIMIGHNGWGEIWYLKDIFPAAPLLGYFEFFYRPHGADLGFDPAEPVTPEAAARVRVKNIGNLLGLHAADAGQTPTWWQHSGYPPEYASRLHVVHEGIDTRLAAPQPKASVALRNRELVLTPRDEIITYVARNLEPYRGFPTFMRSLPAILAERPAARVVIVGGSEVSYGARPAGAANWRELMLEEVGGALDMSRVHFVGKIPHPVLMQLFQVSTVHVYLTYPFVLSWSMLEAMSAGCLVVGSDTAPVREAIVHGENGLLADFFDSAALARQVVDTLAHRNDYLPLRQAARATVQQRYDLLDVCLPAQLALLERVRGK